MSMHGGFMGRAARGTDGGPRLRELDRGTLRAFLGYLKPQARRIALVVGVLAVTAALETLVPYLNKVTMDEHILGGNLAGLHWMLLAYALVQGAGWFYSYWGSRLAVDTGQRLVSQVRRDLFAHIAGLSQDFFDEAATGDSLSRLTGDVDSLRDLVSEGIVDSAGDLLSLVGVLGAMFALNVRLALLVLVTVPVILLGTMLLNRHMRRAYGDVRESVGRMSAGAEEDLGGIRVIQSLAREGSNAGAFEKLNRENLKAHLRATVVSALFFPFVSLTGVLGTALVLLGGGLMLVRGEPGMSAGMILAFIGYANRFFMPLRNMSQLFSVYQRAAASFDRIHAVLIREPTVRPPETPLPLPQPVRGDFALEGVRFGYREDRPVLRDLNLRIPAGSTTALVGPTGAGKSTLARLLARLYDPWEGRVTLDGLDLRDLAAADLRAAVMLVPQEVFLFSGTILENIRFGDPAASDAAVHRAAELACADAFIRNLPKGYASQVGEGGVMLSGGQRQLIAFARAILADRPVLILDEATSSVDAGTEALIRKALDVLLRDRTSLIIAHRFTTLKRASKVIVMEEGSVAGFDTHEALLKSCPLYRSLYEKQWLAGEDQAPRNGQAQ